MTTEQATEAPRAQPRPVKRSLHGDEFIDDYAWMKDPSRSDPDVLSYLQAENAYTAATMRHTESLQVTLFNEIRSRIKETDETAPILDGDWWYYDRIEEGWQYWIQCRKRGSLDAPEHVYLDTNGLAEGYEQFELGPVQVSPNHQLLAYGWETDGSEEYTLHFRDLETGEELRDCISGVEYSVVWANDNRTIFYNTRDEAKRPWRLWRHVLGTDTAKDELVFEEADGAFYLHAWKTRNDRYIVLDLSSAVTRESRILDADDPSGAFRVFAERQQGIEYDINHQGGRFLIRTNEDAPNFRLLETPCDATEREYWRELVPHRDAVKIESIDSFANHIVISERERGLTRLRIQRVSDGDEHYIEIPEAAYTLGSGGNPRYETTTYRFAYTSLVTPMSHFDYEMNDRHSTLVKRQEIPGGYDSSTYRTDRIWARAADGVDVPITIVYRTDTPRDGSGPLWLEGYGSYGVAIDPWFSAARLSLLDRGFVYAIAHVRGGGDLGEGWRNDGKLEKKMNTFTDFIACAEHLIGGRYTSAEQMVISGGSAGGLLVGAVVNLRPDLFKVVIADVPFVDAINTILDPNLLFSVAELEEWGDPNTPEGYATMRAYSPYENVERKAYPNILALAGLNDPRVNYWEPAKWIARLRVCDTAAAKILLKTQMVQGHMGASGRYERWREQAFKYAFALDALAPD